MKLHRIEVPAEHFDLMDSKRLSLGMRPCCTLEREPALCEKYMLYVRREELATSHPGAPILAPLTPPNISIQHLQNGLLIISAIGLSATLIVTVALVLIAIGI